jgi:hypothetical protein
MFCPWLAGSMPEETGSLLARRKALPGTAAIDAIGLNEAACVRSRRSVPCL